MELACAELTLQSRSNPKKMPLFTVFFDFAKIDAHKVTQSNAITQEGASIFGRMPVFNTKNTGTVVTMCMAFQPIARHKLN